MNVDGHIKSSAEARGERESEQTKHTNNTRWYETYIKKRPHNNNSTLGTDSIMVSVVPARQPKVVLVVVVVGDDGARQARRA